MNVKREEEGFEPWANPRNAAAGSLKLLDSKEVAKRKLDIVCYGIAQEEKLVKDSQFAIHKYLKSLNIPVSEESYFAKCKDINDILEFADKIQKIRDKLSFEIDGIVIKVDDISLHKILGVTGKSPRYAVAYKFAPEQAYTTINDITIQVGRTGVLTPVAELEPVKLAGSTISRATLHNEDEIKRKDIRIGDRVVIEKGGDVIPKVVLVDKNKRKKDSKTWHMPKKCPMCQSDVIRKENEVAVRCTNPKCMARRLKKIIFFASKAAMDIEHMGEKVVEQLFEKGLVTRCSDIFLLDENAISQLEGFKEKSIHNLLTSIEKAKVCSLSRFILSLEIPFVGKETADLIAQEATNVENLMNLDEDRLIKIEGIGEKVAKSVVDYFDNEENIEEVKRLLKFGVNPTFTKKKVEKSHPFYHKTFVLTGSLEKYTREEASQLIKMKGGKVSSSVSKNTSYVLAGKEPGSKYDKAKKLDVKIIDENEFEKML